MLPFRGVYPERSEGLRASVHSLSMTGGTFLLRRTCQVHLNHAQRLFFIPMLVSLIALLMPVELQHQYPGFSRAYQLLKGGTIQLLALPERKSLPVVLITVLTQHSLLDLIPLAEHPLPFLV